tara:strand:- start:239 stop:511 length:273 start_codon:yes stop_codon:yes gene_type:complete
MENKTKQLRLAALRFLANGIALLEDIDDLKDTSIYNKEMKYYGNKFITELEKKILPIEKELYKTDQISMVNTIQELTKQFNETLEKQYFD